MPKPTKPLALLTSAVRVQVALSRFNASVRVTDPQVTAPERLDELARRWEGYDLTAATFILDAAAEAIDKLTGEEKT